MKKLFDTSSEFKINAESRCCPPFIRGMIFYQTGKTVWVVEKCVPLEGKVLLGCYTLPKDMVENSDLVDDKTLEDLENQP